MTSDAALGPATESAELYGRVLSCTSYEHISARMLDPVAQALHATSSVFLQFFHMPSRRDCVQRDCYVGSTPECLAAYLDGYYEFDPLLTSSLRWLRSGGEDQSAFVTLLSGFPGWRDLSYYRQFLRPYDIGHVLAILVPVRALNRGELMCVGFHRAHEAPPFSASETGRLRGLLPVLQTVLSNLAYREAMQLSGTVLEAVADSGPGTGFVVLDEDLLVRHANQRGLAELGLYRPGMCASNARSRILGELRERLLAQPTGAAGRTRFTIGIPDAASSRCTALELEVRTFRAIDGRTHYLLVTSSPEEGRALHEALSSCGLSERESEVARLICAGQTNAQIGRELGIAFRTVENHLRSIYAKVRVHSRTQLVSRLLGVH